MKNIMATIGVAVCLLVLVAIYQWVSRGRVMATKIITIDNHTFTVEIADTMFAQARGLSGRASLGDDAGMLFLFSGEANRGFWMRGMNFPLDIVWIKGSTIVGISADLPPATITSVRIYYPPEPVDKVLEINAGLAAKLGIGVGDVIQL